MSDKTLEKKDRVIVRFAGDSGDGMQLVGSRFTEETAVAGNDLATLPDFPAEIRAPAGTPAGVSAFQIHFASRDILTPGDYPNVLVAMNPAALITNVGALDKGSTIIVNEDGFTDHNLKKAGYDSDPLEDGSLDDYQLFRVPMTTMTVRAVEGIDGVSSRDAARSKNMFALGLVSWMYGRPTQPTIDWVEKKFESSAGGARRQPGRLPGRLQLRRDRRAAGGALRGRGRRPAPPGTYRNVNGTTATALGLIAAAVQSGLQLFYASYPITPASELLHALARHKRFGVRTIQAEDEIAAANMVLGASFGGHLGVTATSGPGMDLKSETIGLAVALELPMVVVDVQRAGPSTGMPTKTEAADLLMAMYGRHGESPLPIVAAPTPGKCFDAALEAVRIAVKYRTPGDPAERHLPRQLLGAVADPRRRRPAGDRPGLRHRVQPPRRLHALHARREPGAALGGARHARPAPPDRRPREGGRDRQHLLRAGEPRAHDAPARRADREDRRTTSPSSRSTTPTAPTCWCWAGARATGRSRARPGGCAASTARGSPPRT